MLRHPFRCPGTGAVPRSPPACRRMDREADTRAPFSLPRAPDATRIEEQTWLPRNGPRRRSSRRSADSIAGAPGRVVVASTQPPRALLTGPSSVVPVPPHPMHSCPAVEDPHVSCRPPLPALRAGFRRPAPPTACAAGRIPSSRAAYRLRCRQNSVVPRRRRMRGEQDRSCPPRAAHCLHCRQSSTVPRRRRMRCSVGPVSAWLPVACLDPSPRAARCLRWGLWLPLASSPCRRRCGLGSAPPVCSLTLTEFPRIVTMLPTPQAGCPRIHAHDTETSAAHPLSPHRPLEVIAATARSSASLRETRRNSLGMVKARVPCGVPGLVLSVT
ncbi:hypothetical protein A4R44_09378 [Amycolatopsis sp. M39]|nr:hypothetical protein A4R44_09378 [Amycolatopsis sp. M39]